MQNPIKHGLIALAVSAFLVHGTMAQGPQPGKSQPVLQNPSRVIGKSPDQDEGRLQSTLYTLISVEFPGGTVTDYIEAVKKAAKKAGIDVNVICPSEAREVPVSSITLKSVTLDTAMNALCASFSGSSDYGFDVAGVGKEANESPTFALRIAVYGRNPHYQPGPGGKMMQVGGSDRSSIDVLAVRDLIEPPPGTPVNDSTRVTKDTLMQAVNAAFSLQQDAKPPEILFHAETGLLIVRGTTEQNNLAATVLNRIRDDLVQRRNQSAKGTDSAASRARRRAGMMARLDVYKAEYEEARTTLERNTKLSIEGTIPAEALSKSRLDVVRSEGKLKEALAEVEAAQAEARESGDGEPATTSSASGAVLVRDVYEVYDLHVAPTDMAKLFLAMAGPNGSVSDVQSATESKKITVTAEESKHDNIKLLLTLMRLSNTESAKFPAKGKAK